MSQPNARAEKIASMIIRLNTKKLINAVNGVNGENGEKVFVA